MNRYRPLVKSPERVKAWEYAWNNTSNITYTVWWTHRFTNRIYIQHEIGYTSEVKILDTHWISSLLLGRKCLKTYGSGSLIHTQTVRLKKIIASIKRYIVYDGWVHHHSKIQISIHTSRVAERKLWNLTPRQCIFTVSSFALKLQMPEHTAVKFAVSFEANFFFSLLKISPWNARNKIQFDFSQSVQFHSLIHSYLWWACFCWKRKNRFVRTNWSSFSSSSPNGNGKWLIEKYKNTESQHCLSGHRRTSHLLKLRYDGCFMPIV